MIKNIKILSFALLSALAVSGCNKEKLSDVSVVDSNAVQRQYTELDKWIKENLTLPYGIEVIYRWERNSAQPGSFTYPPKIENIKAVLETVKHLWIDLYTREDFGGKDFMAGKAPIKMHMYGGKNVDRYGFELLSNSTASGSEMYIYNVNEFDPKDPSKVYALMRSVHHQFARRLSELFNYDRDLFLSISQNRYISSTGDFLSTVQKGIYDRNRIFSLSEYAHKRGFLTLNSMLSTQDDFAELISAMIMHTSKEIRQAVKISLVPYPSNDNPEERQKALEEAKQAHHELTTKIEFVTEYFRKNIGLHIGRFQLASNKLIRAHLSNEEISE
ncbi:putative zinc-binding metallopeptidase [Porphyromonas sp.]|uniref:putative zinc-binding metallopeptidase n=1 Tax=Porphyromonas sp. TaxID=1924944 RepID=UPI0026DD0C5A|nr:putative zinc-binding metallopeptidase [Porphyromonas sp.]MDO4771271.1 putative zinc-binding metallopeptidase [Porphyromonas sp.]